jgi:hypothetical protein
LATDELKVTACPEHRVLFMAELLMVTSGATDGMTEIARFEEVTLTGLKQPEVLLTLKATLALF